jgi:hypothetical protein
MPRGFGLPGIVVPFGPCIVVSGVLLAAATVALAFGPDGALLNAADEGRIPMSVNGREMDRSWMTSKSGHRYMVFMVGFIAAVWLLFGVALSLR